MSPSEPATQLQTSGSFLKAVDIAKRLFEDFGTPAGVVGYRPGLVPTDDPNTFSAVVNIVVEPGTAFAGMPNKIDGVPVLIREAEPLELIDGVIQPKAWLGEETEAGGGAPNIKYRPPEPDEVELSPSEVTSIHCHAGPDSGWTTLKPFLEGTESTLTVAMYEFYAEHIVDFAVGLGENEGLSLDMILQVSENDETIEDDLRSTWGERLQFTKASVSGPNRIFNNSYHTKVAVRDSKAFWLSSGNWSPNSQPLIADGFTGNFYSKGNREWHVIVEDEPLAQVFEKFIRYDIRTAREIEAPEALPLLPDLFVPLELLEEREAAVAQPHQFKGKSFGSAEETITIEPLLSPDNYADKIHSLIQSAEESLYLQFSYIRQPSREGFDRIIDAVGEKMRDGLDVRVLVGTSQQEQHSVFLIGTKGWESEMFRKQTSKIHNKGILVDGKIAVVGSNNWSSDGTQYNRDASLIIHSPEVTDYFTEIFLFDWDNLSRPIISGNESLPVVAPEGQAAPEGMVRVPWREWYE